MFTILSSHRTKDDIGGHGIHCHTGHNINIVDGKINITGSLVAIDVYSNTTVASYVIKSHEKSTHIICTIYGKFDVRSLDRPDPYLSITIQKIMDKWLLSISEDELLHGAPELRFVSNRHFIVGSSYVENIYAIDKYEIEFEGENVVPTITE